MDAKDDSKECKEITLPTKEVTLPTKEVTVTAELPAANPDTRMAWVEKYRPRTIQDISHQPHVVAALKTQLASRNIPHILLHGPPGTGKTSTILAVARELYGPLASSMLLELNASNERGIDVIRTKVKKFALGSVAGAASPQFKIIILDEADSMSRDAQSALRRIMEQYSKVTRFCIICNCISRIIEPLISRCAKFRYTPLSSESIATRLQFIATQESVAIAQSGMDAIITVARGDMRQAIALLQSSRKLTPSPSEPVTDEHVWEMAGVIPTGILAAVLTSVKSSTDVADSYLQCEQLIGSGYSVAQFLLQFQELLISDLSIGDGIKAQVCIRLVETEKKLLQGADELLQLLDIVSFIGGLLMCRKPTG